MRYTLVPRWECWHAETATVTGVNPPSPPPPSPAVTVKVQNNQFSPVEARVTAGGTVTWEWEASTA